MTKTENKSLISYEPLFNRVVSILEQARAYVVRSVNSRMIIAYWLIGKEIVKELQNGDKRAEYGGRLLQELSARLTKHCGKGFSTPNLKMFRQFYISFYERIPQIRYTVCSQFDSKQISDTDHENSEKDTHCVPFSKKGFSPNLGWSHYRILMRIENIKARDFYEQEAAFHVLG